MDPGVTLKGLNASKVPMVNRTEDRLARLATVLSAATGAPLLDALLREFTTTLGADCALVAERLPDNPARVRTLAVFHRGEPAPNFEYDLPGTPAESLPESGTAVFAAGVAAAFPAAAFLTERGV